MCGIAGFSLSKGARVNARRLAHELLNEIELRGTHASGFAYVQDGASDVYKRPKPGSQLSLSELPRNAGTTILHTRYATQGSHLENQNNHPVMSPEGMIALVHNGVISNDWELRKELPKGLAEVDTAVIPALLESKGLDAMEDLWGYAAIAYLDLTDAKDTLHLARMESSPVAYTWLDDGSFVFASTIRHLTSALMNYGLDYGHVFEMAEGDYFEVVNGVIMKYRNDVVMQDDYKAYARYSSATAGGHGAPRALTAGSEITGSMSMGSSFYSNSSRFDDEEMEEDLSWDDDYRARSCSIIDTAMAMAPETNGIESDPGESNSQGFYLTTEDGAMEWFPQLDMLEAQLAWYARLSLYDGAPFPEVEERVRWVNHVIDMGEITVKGGLESWVEDMAQIDEHESVATYNLSYIREGASLIAGIRE